MIWLDVWIKKGRAGLAFCALLTHSDLQHRLHPRFRMLPRPKPDEWPAWGQVLYDDGEDEWLDLRAEAARALPPAAVSAGLPTGADCAGSQPLLGLAGMCSHVTMCSVASLQQCPFLPFL